MQSPKVSVIVPVYKVEKYLRRCVDSILAQTFPDLELLLIDDGSPDNSGKICDEYAALDPRVRVFHKSNGGVSSARNLGLDKARGEWIVFVDSDDWVTEEYLADLMKDSDADLRLNGFDCIGDLEDWETTMPDSRYSTPEELAECMTRFGSINFRCPYCKRYRRSVIEEHGIRFDKNISYGEDAVFVYDYLQYVDSISLSSGKFYKYNCEMPESLSRKIEIRTPALFMNRISSAVRGLEKKYSQTLEKLEFDLLSGTFVNDIFNISNSNIAFRKKIRKIKELIKTDFGRNILKIDNYRTKTKKCHYIIDYPAMIGLPSLSAVIIIINKGYPFKGWI